MEAQVTWRSVVVFLVLSLALSACAPDKRVDELQNAFGGLKSEVASLREEVETLKRDQAKKTLASLSPAAQGFTTVQFDLGVMPVKLVNVVEYAGGSKVTLGFLNPLSYQLGGLKGNIAYVPRGPSGEPDVQNMKTKEFTMVKPLLPAIWRETTVILPGVPPSQLLYITLGDISTPSISAP